MSIVTRSRTGKHRQKNVSIRLYEAPVVILPVDQRSQCLMRCPWEELAEESLLQPASDIPAMRKPPDGWRENAGRIVLRP